MKALSCYVAVVLAGVAVSVTGCGGDSTGTGPQAASVTGVAGDSQVAPTGAPLSFPLSLTVLGSNGQPIQGVNVTWTVTPTNRVTFALATTPSDVNGVAETHVTAGATPDTVLIQAHVPGVEQPVDFHIAIVDPCLIATSHTIGTSVNGALTTYDCKLQLGLTNNNIPLFWFYDFYVFSLASQTGVTINMTATFDTYLDIYRDFGTTFEPMGFNDDVSSADLTSRVQAILAPGDYLIGANSADTLVTGSYTLSSVSRAQTIDNCPELFVTRGVVINDNISATDCPDTTGVGSYGDTLKIWVLKGSVLKIAQRSSAINANLRLFQRLFSQTPGQPDMVTLVAANNDSADAGTTTNAFISYSVPVIQGPQAVLLEIFVGTSGTNQTGAYTLEIFSSTTLSAMRKADAASPWGVRLRGRPVPQLGLRRGL